MEDREGSNQEPEINEERDDNENGEENQVGDEPPSKKQKLECQENKTDASQVNQTKASQENKGEASHEAETVEDNGSLCCLCLERCQSKTNHKLCVIRCGHYFGESCLQEYLNGKRRGHCPTCRKPFWKRDIRCLFINRVIALDMSKNVDYKRQIAELTNNKNNLSLTRIHYIHKRHNLQENIARKKQEINDILCKHNVDLENQRKAVADLKLHHTFTVNKQGGSRVMDYNQEQNLLAVSTQENNSVFGQVFGIKQITVSNNKLVNFVTPHQKPIKDIKFHPTNPWILTVSHDKTIQVMNTTAKSAFAKTTATSPIWSCCWAPNDLNTLYCGGQQGNVLIYDIRNFASPVENHQIPLDCSPVISVTKSERNIFCATLNSISVIDSSSVNTKLPVEGPFVSMSPQIGPENKFLVSARPNSKSPFVRHVLTHLTINLENSGKSCDLSYTIEGGNVLTRMAKSCLYYRNNNYFVADYNEQKKYVEVWDVKNRENISNLNCDEGILDIAYVQSEFASYLACLSDTKVNFYKFH